MYKEFQYADFTALSVFLIMLGLVSYVVFSFAAEYIFKKWESRRAKAVANSNQVVASSEENHSSSVADPEMKAARWSPYKRIDFPIWFMLLGLLFVAWCCYSTFHYIQNYVITTNGQAEYTLQNYIAIFHSYVTNASYETNPPQYLGIAQRMVEIVSIFCIFAFVYNICLSRISWKDIFYLAGGCGWIVQMILWSNRGYFLSLMSLVVYLVYYFLKLRFQWKKKIDIIIAFSGALLLICFLPCFLKMHEMLGRGAIGRDSALWVITIYVNSGIRDFDIFLRNPTFPSVPGAELFYGVYKSLHVFLHSGDNVVRHLEMVALNDVGYSNIFTSFRRFYTTGREAGIIFFAGMQGVIYTVGYIFNRENLKKGRVIFNVLLFSYFSNAIFYLPVDDIFYTTYISLGIPARILLMYVIYFLFFRKQLNLPMEKVEGAAQ